MAKVLNYETQIGQGLVIESWHVSQSVDAFTGVDAYDITLSGSSTVIGTNIMSSSASPSITSILTDNDSHPFITGIDTTGPNFRMNLVDANSSGSAYMALGRQSGNFAGTGFVAHYATGSNASEGEIVMAIGKNGDVVNGFHDRFIVQSEPGPIASNTDSELSLVVGGPITGRRHVLGNVQTGTGEFAAFAAGIDKEFGRKRFVVLEYSAASTSSQAGFTSSSLNGTGVPNFNTNTVPFGIDAGHQLTDTSFYIDRGGSLGSGAPVTASLQISRGGSIDMEGHITASGNISSSGNLFANDVDINGEYYIQGNHTLQISGGNRLMFGTALAYDILQIGNAINPPNSVELHGPVTAFSSISASGALYGSKLFIDDKATIDLYSGAGDELTLNPDATWDAIRLHRDGSPKPIILNGNVTGSGHGLFQAGKPIKTHITSPISTSLANAGFYHIVGGGLTASIVLDSSAPVGAEYEFFQTSSAGQFLFESASGTTVISKNNNLKLSGLGSAATLKKVATSTFHLVGDLTS